MTVSEITIEDVVEYLKLEEDQYTEKLMGTILEAAKSYVSEYTGLPQAADDDRKTLDSYPEISLAVYVVCQDMYDNRSMYIGQTGTAKNYTNKTVETILEMHRRNLL